MNNSLSDHLEYSSSEIFCPFPSKVRADTHDHSVHSYLVFLIIINIHYNFMCYCTFHIVVSSCSSLVDNLFFLQRVLDLVSKISN